MDEDEDTYVLISEEELLTTLAEVGQQLEELAGTMATLHVRFQERVMDEEAHVCPLDHAVMEALEQSKYRLSEAVMWLKTAIATKIDEEPMVAVQAPAEHDPQKVN